MNIPDEALEAAAEFLFMDYSVTPYYRDQLRAALEAAAPHLMSKAWEEGRIDGWAESRSGYENALNPYEKGKA